jgi:uncharacterized Zn finger protein
MDIIVATLYWGDGREHGVMFQVLGRNEEELVANLNKEIDEYNVGHYGEDQDECGLPHFVLDGAWADEPEPQSELELEPPEPAIDRISDIEEQLENYCRVSDMLAGASVIKHQFS